MRINSNHRLAGVEYKATPNVSGYLDEPPLLVLHDTAGPSARSAINWLTQRRARASAHIVIGEDGSITQLAPFNRVTWHAGRSVYRGRKGVNDFSIGIEMVNPGQLDSRGRAWFETSYPDSVSIRTAEHGSGRWEAYKEAQLRAVFDLIAVLGETYPSLRDVVGHWFVSPGRKVDPNPLFPMEMALTSLQGRGDNIGIPEEIEPDGGLLDGPWALVSVSGLNLRKWPTNNDQNILIQMSEGDAVELIRSGVFAHGFPEAKWYRVRHLRSGEEGWAHSAFLDVQP